MQTEFERLQAKTILYRVITNLNLNSHWAMKRGTKAPLSMEETYLLLKRQIDITTGRSLFLISVFSKDPAEAALIANTITEVYRNHGNSGRQVPGGLVPTELVEIVDAAEPPSRPSRGRNSHGLLPVMLFALGMVNIFAGYFLARPALSSGVGLPPAGRS